MSAVVRYLIVHDSQPDELRSELVDQLDQALREADVMVDYRNSGDTLSIDYTVSIEPEPPLMMSGVSLTVIWEDEEWAAAANAFHDALRSLSIPGVKHVVKFADPLVDARREQLARELFALEMRLREALTVIFVFNYGEDFLNLLRESTQAPPAKERPNAEQMATNMENEFFHLLFSQYPLLAERKEVKSVADVTGLIRSVTDFSALQQELTRPIIAEEKHRDFIASLKSVMDPIEKVRNCVAHNRTVSERLHGDYANAKQQLEEKLEAFLKGPMEP